jgi:hypothetical protein
MRHWRHSLRKAARFIPPADYDRIKAVNSFDELVTSRFGPKINAICWTRALDGNFDELAARFSAEEEIISLDEESLHKIRKDLSPAGRMAIDTLLEDRRLLREHGLSPSLECVPRYQRDDIAQTIQTDVYSFHADRATIETDTYLCSYNEAATEGLRNDQAQRHIDIPATRTKLLGLFQQEETGNFDDYLRDHCYDLHYAQFVEATPFSFGIGNLWRIAVEYPGCPVPPCLHRAPKTLPGQPPRLLLIS